MQEQQKQMQQQKQTKVVAKPKAVVKEQEVIDIDFDKISREMIDERNNNSKANTSAEAKPQNGLQSKVDSLNQKKTNLQSSIDRLKSKAKK